MEKSRFPVNLTVSHACSLLGGLSQNCRGQGHAVNPSLLPLISEGNKIHPACANEQASLN